MLTSPYNVGMFHQFKQYPKLLQRNNDYTPVLGNLAKIAPTTFKSGGSVGLEFLTKTFPNSQAKNQVIQMGQDKNVTFFNAPPPLEPTYDVTNFHFKAKDDPFTEKELVELILLRQFIAACAIPHTIEMAENAISMGKKIIIFTSFSDELEILSAPVSLRLFHQF